MNTEPASNASVVPFTVLTGWLGAGKTTVLNRMLRAPQGRRIAVLVNELGRIAIDTKLILSRGSDVLELAGGCVCCKMDTKNDLWDGIAEVIARSQPDHVVLETTGIAEPAAIFDGFHRIPEAIRARVVPAGVIAVVDADAGAATLARRDEARAQVAVADRLLLSKLDLAEAAKAREVHAALDALGVTAERAAFPAGEAADAAMVAWLLEPRPLHGALAGLHTCDAACAHHHAHAPHGQLVAASFDDAAPLLPERVLAVLEAQRSRLVRVKGFVHVQGWAQLGFVELAGNQLSLTPWSGEAPAEGERRSSMVLIGDGLDEAEVRRALWSCRVAS